MPVLGSAVDRAASAFIEDLHERGLSDKLLPVITGEFGRTPKINNKALRDAEPTPLPIVVGYRCGRQIGDTVQRSSRPPARSGSA
jgi:hypothetical protein